MNKRRQIIVNPKVQLKLIVLILSVAIAPVIVLFVGFSMYAGLMLEKIPAENETLVSLVHSIQVLNMMTFAGFLIVLIALAIVETKFLHKIIGPLYRIENDLDEILTTNDFSRKITIRKDDYLHTLADKINRLVVKARG